VREAAPLLDQTVLPLEPDQYEKARVQVGITNRSQPSVRILSVRPSCASCLREREPLSHPDRLKRGGSAAIGIALDASKVDKLRELRIFLETDNPYRPVEVCHILGPRGRARLLPRMRKLPALVQGQRTEWEVPLVLRGPLARDLQGLKASVCSRQGSQVQEVRIYVQEEGYHRRYGHFAICSAVFDSRTMNDVRTTRPTRTVVGRRRTDAWLIVRSDAGELGRVWLTQDVVEPLIANVAQVFFIGADSREESLTRQFELKPVIEGTRVITDGVRVERTSSFLQVRCKSRLNGEWLVTVQAHARSGPPGSVLKDHVIAPYVSGDLQGTLRIPVFLVPAQVSR